MLIAEKGKAKKKRKKIPDYLIYEVMDGKPIYRKGYKSVLSKKKTVEEIMGSSSLQAILIGLIVKFLNQNLSDGYIVGSAEMGLHIQTNQNLSMDIPIYEISKLSVLTQHYAEVPPKIVIEVDVEADTENFANDFEYYFNKTQKLLDFQVEKVIWIFTYAQKVIVSEPNKPWITLNWTDTIEIMPEIQFSIQTLIDKAGFTIAK